MSVAALSKKFLFFLLSFIMLISFVGCSTNKSVKNIESKKINYNNIYEFMHSGFWVDNNSIYYRKSGLYNNLYYYADNSGNHLITTNNKFNISVAKDIEGQISGEIQAFGDYVYFWYERISENREQNDLYQYNIKSKKFKKVLSVNQNVSEWTIFENMVLYSCFINGKDENINSLWCGVIDSKELPIKIADETTAFGIRKNKIVYTQKDNAAQSILYEYDYQSKESVKLCSFVGIYENYNPYNFTDSSVVFATDKLQVVDIETGVQKSFDLSGYTEFFNCYEEYAFACINSNIYRINVLTGESKLVSDKLKECVLIYAISDECAVAISYKNSGFRTKVEVCAIYADGRTEKIFNI